MPALPPDPAPLLIRLLGDLELRRGDVLLPLPPSRRTRALFGYLVASREAHTRSALCDLLWEGPDDPRASLRWSLTKLRPLLDGGDAQRLVADRERVAFEARHCEIDADRVQVLLAGGAATAPVGALEEAAALLRSEFLDGLDLPGCYRFHHWRMTQREHYGRLRRAVLERLVVHYAHAPEQALPHAHAMVAADPLTEAAHATLVRLFAAAGRYPDAERHYEWARDLLRREIALAPGGALDEAIRSVRRDVREAAQRGDSAAAAAVADAQALPPVAAPSTAPSPEVVSEAAPAAPAPAATLAAGAPAAPPLLGRNAEHESIPRWLAGHDVKLLLLTGEPGIGKTRLLEHLAQVAAQGGCRVLRGRCFEAEMARPYGPWLDALRGLSGDGVAAATLVQVAPLLAGQAAEDGNRERLFDGAVALLRHLAAKQPLVLLFDDLQWIDESSAALLHYVARTLDDETPLRLAGAARAGEIEDNIRAKGLLHSLAREGGLLRLELLPLGEAEARELLAGSAGELDMGDVWRSSGGNPMYLLELARAARRGAAAAGRSVEELIDDRLRTLDAASRDLLGWAAASGGPLRADLLAEAAGLPVAEVLAHLDRFEQRGLLRPAGSGRFDFAHDLLRQAVYRALSQPWRETMHRRFARVLTAASSSDPWLHGDIVRHAALAHDPAGTARACLAAAEHCLTVFANGEAGALAEQGLNAVGELTPGAERVRLEIGLLNQRVVAAAGPGGRRLPALDERIEAAIRVAEALAMHAEAAAGWQILAFWQQRASDTGRTQASTLAAQRLTRRADAATHCRQLANSGRCLLDIEADAVRGRELIDEATTLAAELDLQVMEIEWGRGLIERAQGRLDAAAASFLRAVTLARLTANHWRELECLTGLATVEFEAGRHADVQRHVAEIVAAAARMGDARAPFAQALGALACLHERADAPAQALLAASLQQLRELDDKAHLAYALNETASLALAAGRREEAAAHANEALAAARAVRRPTEVAVALALLARSAADAQAAAGWLAQLPQEPGSARAEAALAAARGGVSTPAPTVAP